MDTLYSIKSALFGLAIGDALGVPVEFRPRTSLKHNPVLDMEGFGTHNQPVGTWSDDSSLTFCLVDSLTECGGLELKDVANSFVRWYEYGFWTATGKAFDIGNTTRAALGKFKFDNNAETCGEPYYDSNGNGALMRILPLVFYLWDKPIEERWGITQQVAGITHAHMLSHVGCFYYLEFARKLIEGKNFHVAYAECKEEVREFLLTNFVNCTLLFEYDYIFYEDINRAEEENIKSSGFVVDTLEAAIWCCLTSDSYEETVLKAVNLGSDTDTVAAVAGGLAGLYYGYNKIPAKWLNKIARLDDINELCEKFYNSGVCGDLKDVQERGLTT